MTGAGTQACARRRLGERRRRLAQLVHEHVHERRGLAPSSTRSPRARAAARAGRRPGSRRPSRRTELGTSCRRAFARPLQPGAGPITAPLDYIGAGSATDESRCNAVAIGANGMYAVGRRDAARPATTGRGAAEVLRTAQSGSGALWTTQTYGERGAARRLRRPAGPVRRRSTTACCRACSPTSPAAPWTPRWRPTWRRRRWPRPTRRDRRFRDRGEGSASAWLYTIAARKLGRYRAACASRTRRGGGSAWSASSWRRGRRARRGAHRLRARRPGGEGRLRRRCAATSARPCACA